MKINIKVNLFKFIIVSLLTASSLIHTTVSACGEPTVSTADTNSLDIISETKPEEGMSLAAL